MWLNYLLRKCFNGKLVQWTLFKINSHEGSFQAFFHGFMLPIFPNQHKNFNYRVTLFWKPKLIFLQLSQDFNSSKIYAVSDIMPVKILGSTKYGFKTLVINSSKTTFTCLWKLVSFIAGKDLILLKWALFSYSIHNF